MTFKEFVLMESHRYNFVHNALYNLLRSELVRESDQEWIREIRSMSNIEDRWHSCLALSDRLQEMGLGVLARGLQWAVAEEQRQERTRLDNLPLNITNNVKDLVKAFESDADNLYALADALEEAGCQEWANEIRTEGRYAAKILADIMKRRKL